jgi:hypothetical protein
VKIPSFVLRQLYVPGSLARDGDGLRFLLRNTLATATLTGLRALTVDGRPVAREQVEVRIGERVLRAGDVADGAAVEFPRHAEAEVRVAGAAAAGPKAKVRLEALSKEFGELVIQFDDAVAP